MGPNPRSPKQSVERGYLARMPALWKALNDAQRAAWRSFAADPAQELENPLGEAYFASGYNWFCKCNVRLLRVGRATIQAVPVQARPAAPTIDDFRVCEAGIEEDLCVCGVASASTEDPGEESDKAFDDNLVTYWQTPFGNTTGWLRYDFCDPVNIKRYRIYGRQGWAARNPKDWNFQAWLIGVWVTLQTVTDAAVPDLTWVDYYCPNAEMAWDYRINVTANAGDGDRLNIAEFEMYLGEKGSSVVIYPEDNFDDAPDYDLILHVSMGASIGMGVQYPGYLETVATQNPGRWYEFFQTPLEANFGTILQERSWFAQLYRQTREGLRSSAATERAVTLDC
ncbi:hypothetical protein ES703_81870 [subsurface metagenome]